LNYPFWDVPVIGGGMLIGLVAILHVFVAHLAVGGGLYLVLAETRARRTNNAALLRAVETQSRVFALITLVFGAVSGVGIWWTIGLVAPTATSALIHIFVWCWAIEWVFFLVEIVAAFIYYTGWKRMSARDHIAVGWIYFVSAWMSLFVINGILTFMLTTGHWPYTGQVLDAFFNPSMWPSLVIRTCIAIAMAGLFALVAGSIAQPAGLKRWLVRYGAKWVLGGVCILPFAGFWYVSTLPPMAREISMGGAPVVTIFAGASILISAAIVVAVLVGPMLFPQQFHVSAAVVIVLLALAATGVTEWVREAVRKPYVIYGYLYSNSISPWDRARLDAEGILATAKWSGSKADTTRMPLEAGARIFRLQCQSCHTVNGFNAVRPLVKGWDAEFMDHQLRKLETLKGYMPPFMGTSEERLALGQWLLNLNEAK